MIKISAKHSLKCKFHTTDQVERINALNERKIDFRQLIMLKNKLFDSPLVNTDNFMTINAFNELCDRFESDDLKACFTSVQDSLIAGISDGDMINLAKFS